MILRIDKSGRLLVPKAIRQQWGLAPHTPLELVPSPDGLLLRRVGDPAALQQRDGLWVHEGKASAGLTWHQAVDDLRDARADAAWRA